MDGAFLVRLDANYIKSLSKNLDSTNDLFLMDYGDLQNLHEFIKKSFDVSDLTNEEYVELVKLHANSKLVLKYAETRNKWYL